MHGPSDPTLRGRDDGARLLIGIDAGKVTTSLAWGRLRRRRRRCIVEGASAARHLGEPLAPFFALYRELGPARLAGVVAAGAFGDRLTTPALAGIPEEIAQEWAVRVLYGDEGPLNVVRIGGSGYSVLTRDAAGRIDYETNERCSAGTGETVEGLCARLGCGLDEAVALAAGADRGITVTSRCAVFAKSELTHFANQGEDHGRLFRGLFESVARNVHALYDRAKVDGPGGARRPRGTDRAAGRGLPRARAGARRGLAAGGRLRGARRPAGSGLALVGRGAWPRDPRSSSSRAAGACARCRRPATAPARWCSSAPPRPADGRGSPAR